MMRIDTDRHINIRSTSTFPAEKQGYSKRHVDAYINKLQAKTKQIIATNNQLFLLWMNEYEKEKSMHKLASEHGIPDYASKRQALMQLMEQSYQYSGMPHGTTQGDIQDISQGMAQSAVQGTAQEIAQGIPQDAVPEASQEMAQATSQEIEPDLLPPPATQKTSSRIRSGIASLLFYMFLASILVGIFLVGSTADGSPRNLLGFSAMTVLTRSMQSEIPQNSLVLIRHVEPAKIQVGDDITYLLRNNSTITHRVISIRENYENSGMLGFETQGLMNENPDSEIVLAANVIGRVIFHNLTLGRIILFIRANVLLIVILCATGIALSISLRFWLSGRNNARSIVRHT